MHDFFTLPTSLKNPLFKKKLFQPWTFSPFLETDFTVFSLAYRFFVVLACFIIFSVFSSVSDVKLAIS